MDTKLVLRYIKNQIKLYRLHLHYIFLKCIYALKNKKKNMKRIWALEVYNINPLKERKKWLHATLRKQRVWRERRRCNALIPKGRRATSYNLKIILYNTNIFSNKLKIKYKLYSNSPLLCLARNRSWSTKFVLSFPSAFSHSLSHCLYSINISFLLKLVQLKHNVHTLDESDFCCQFTSQSNQCSVV